MSAYLHNYQAKSTASAGAISVFRDIRVLNVMLVAATASLFLGYLVLNNASATKGFTVRTMQRKISELQDRGQKLDLQVVSNQSMDAIQAQARNLGFVPVANVDYVDAAGGVVAVK